MEPWSKAIQISCLVVYNNAMNIYKAETCLKTYQLAKHHEKRISSTYYFRFHLTFLFRIVQNWELTKPHPELLDDFHQKENQSKSIDNVLSTPSSKLPQRIGSISRRGTVMGNLE